MYHKIASSGRLFARSQLMWQPSRTSHDPNPPLPIETGGLSITLVKATVAWLGTAAGTNARLQFTVPSGAWLWSGIASGLNAKLQMALTIGIWRWRPRAFAFGTPTKLMMLLKVGAP